MPKYSETQTSTSKRVLNTFKFQDFSSISEFVDYIEKAETNAVFTRNNRELDSKSTSRSYSSWAGTKSFEEAKEIMASGWTEEAKKISKSLPVSTVSSNIKKSRPTFGVVGGTPSVPRYLQGIPTNMIDRKPEVQKNKIISITRDISFSAMVDPEVIRAEGIKALQVIQLLENKGFRVKLNIGWAVTNERETLAFRVTVKKPEERMAISKIAFPIAHPSFLRRLAFRALETFPTMESNGFIRGYGTPAGSEFRKYITEQKEYFLPALSPFKNAEEIVESFKIQ